MGALMSSSPGGGEKQEEGSAGQALWLEPERQSIASGSPVQRQRVGLFLYCDLEAKLKSVQPLPHSCQISGRGEQIPGPWCDLSPQHSHFPALTKAGEMD